MSQENTQKRKVAIGSIEIQMLTSFVVVIVKSCQDYFFGLVLRADQAFFPLSGKRRLRW